MVGRTIFTSATRWLIPVLLVLSGCEENNPLNLGAFIPPSVIRTNPANGATGVPTNTPIIVTFDMCVDCSSMNNGTCRMPHNTFTKDWCDMCEYEMVLIPDSLFAPNTRHTIVISKSVRSVRGQEMREDFSFSFTTGPGAQPVIHRLSSERVRVSDTLTIFGEYFLPGISNNTVSIGNDTVPILRASADSIVLKVPREYVHGNVSVTTIGGTGTSSMTFSPLWAQAELSSAGAMHAVAWSGSRYAAVGDEGVIAYSDNGFDWRAGTSPGDLSIRDVLWDGEQFVAVAYEGRILTSPDGESYTQVSSLATLAWAIAWSGDTYVVVGGYQPRIYASADLSNWTTFVANNYLWNVEWAGARFYAVGDSNTLLLSDDGADWSAVPRAGVPTMSYRSATEFAGQLVIGAFQGGGINRFYSTPLSFPGTWTNIWTGDIWQQPYGPPLVVDDKFAIIAGTWIIFTEEQIEWHQDRSAGSVFNPSSGGTERILKTLYAGDVFIAVCSLGSVVTSPVGYTLRYVGQ